MTEVPEHLLRRSKERREALGLSGGTPAGESGGGEGAPPAAAELGTGAPSSASAPERATSSAEASTPAPAASAAPAGAPVADSPGQATPQYLAAKGKNRIPFWVMPVLAALPLWGILYFGAFGSRDAPPPLTGLALGQEVYTSAGCSGCHGAAGEGGVGPALEGEESELTFPDPEEQAEWIRTGSSSFAGRMYGDPARPGGQRGPATGGMPAFAGSLSEEEILAVTQYERERL